MKMNQTENELFKLRQQHLTLLKKQKTAYINNFKPSHTSQALHQSFDALSKQFTLVSTHPGVSLEDILDNTGFNFKVPKNIVITSEPDANRLLLLRKSVGPKIAKTYPEFAARVFN